MVFAVNPVAQPETHEVPDGKVVQLPPVSFAVKVTLQAFGTHTNVGEERVPFEHEYEVDPTEAEKPALHPTSQRVPFVKNPGSEHGVGAPGTIEGEKLVGSAQSADAVHTKVGSVRWP